MASKTHLRKFWTQRIKEDSAALGILIRNNRRLPYVTKALQGDFVGIRESLLNRARRKEVPIRLVFQPCPCEDPECQMPVLITSNGSVIGY